jgi:hypothetical protein
VWYSRGVKRLSIVLLSFLVASCGHRKSEQAPSSSTAGSGDAVLQLGPGLDGSKVKVMVVPFDGKLLPRDIERFTLAVIENFTVLRIVELQPGDSGATGGELTLTYDPALVSGLPDDALRAVVVGKDGKPLDIAVATVSRGKVKLAVPQLAHVLLLAPRSGVQLLGTAAQIMLGQSRMFFDDPCAKYLAPGAPKISALVSDPKRFAIDADGKVTLDAKLELRPTSLVPTDRPVEEVLASGGGDSVDLSIVLGSLLLARKLPVSLVVGTVARPADHPAQRGLWQWVMTIVDGKTYFVDAFDPSAIRLVPIADAARQITFRPTRGCVRTPDGKPVPAGSWAMPEPAANPSAP